MTSKLCHLTLWAKIGGKRNHISDEKPVFGGVGRGDPKRYWVTGSISLRGALSNFVSSSPLFLASFFSPLFSQFLTHKPTDKHRGSQPIFFLSKSVTMRHSLFTGVLFRPESWPHAYNLLGGSWPHLALHSSTVSPVITSSGWDNSFILQLIKSKL